ncbi:TrkH family potassium uptake protein [Dorea longicatena]|jgi:trk system potassium uptake protein TrkH|uniref:TrkH family potassium uptake protein n=1 Tax=Dorea longicatena TaxID=88431 RepID=A0A414SXL3_9FIRM|nr:TrkH family potassium uptake protein [Dorea longicatena]RHG26614.1 TrkH family potassium uptake protein [Dorea longicatena]
MNTKIVRYILCRMLGVEAALLLVPVLVAVIYQEKCGIVFLIPIVILCLLFLVAGRKRPEHGQIYGKEGMVIVALAWILWSLFGAMPFTLSGYIPSYVDAFFETVSGFTTTGSSIIPDVEVLPHCLLFWRSFTHWIGGMGVLVFVLVVTSLDRKNSMHLMRAEVPGPEKDKLVPKAMSTARILYGMYLTLTVIEMVFLVIGGMNLFDSMIFSFGSAGTGGFSNYADSVAHFNSAYIDGVITVFCALFGVNFALFYFMILGDFKSILKNEELRTYILLIAGATAAIMLNIHSLYPTIGKSFRYAVFQVVTVITTTGYSTADFAQWPMFSKAVLMMLTVIGACASSTGGGIKVSRLLVGMKCVKREIVQLAHPKSVGIIRIGGKKVSSDVLRTIYIYFIAYVGILIGSVVLVSLDNFDFETTFSAVLTTLGNVGPGMAQVGPMGNFAEFSPLSKLILCFDMLAGRLEIFPFLVLFTAPAWRRKF